MEFEVQPKKFDRHSCPVSGCDSRAKDKDVIFHRFPKRNERFVYKQNIFGNVDKVDLFKAWESALKIKNITKITRVCSLHFDENDYYNYENKSPSRVLKRNAIPTCNLPGEAKTMGGSAKAIISEQMIKEEVETEHIKVEEIESVESVDQQLIYAENYTDHDQESIGIQNINVYTGQPMHSVFVNPEPITKDQSVQVNVNCVTPTIMRIIYSEQQLNAMTGLESLKILETIVEIVKIASNKKYENYSANLNTTERVLLTYVKLKHNLSYTFLAAFFNCTSPTQCRNIFYETTKILGKSLKAAVPWLSKQEITENLPKSFEGFENVRIVVEFIKIFVEIPENRPGQVSAQSNLKLKNMLKIMIAVSPTGTFTYLSKVYTGISNNCEIFRQSGLMQLLEPGDAIMVSGNSQIEEVCEENQWECIREPTLQDMKNYTKEESLQGAKITRARVHLILLHQKIKNFKIVGEIMPIVPMSIVEDIFTVICATINMSAPILSDDKFINGT